MKEIHVNDWVEFKHNDAEMGGLVTEVLNDNKIIVVHADRAYRMTIPISTVVRVNYIEVEKR